MSSVISCPSCAAIVVPNEAGDVCPHCRTPLPDADVLTRLADGDMTRPAALSGSRANSDSRSSGSATTGWLSSSGGIDHGRFAPGALLGGRYRIIQRLGRGGMGEVYRADDLKLGQPVALKFLPAEVDRDPARLTQLHTEVRMARQVSHPNVCRVYDIDEIEGSTFLSMEFVDGEDLASLLRRIGRFPEDRALEIARQVCAGLAAAHDRQVVHRDLKPANIMIDGTGKVRITDFGLAGLAGEQIRAGTPAYMSPEQLAGGEVTTRSDIYSLGLVLYEIFTGQRALEGKNLAELIHKREHSGIVSPTALVTTLDPKIELAIMRCLKPQPDERPASALAVAAALPGGDPLAAALAAGETPSPDMVAAAGHTEALHPAIGLALVATIMVGLIIGAVLSDRQLLYARVPMQKSLDSLQDRAREILTGLGHNVAGHDSARGLSINFDVIRHISNTSQSADRWNQLDKRTAPVMLFWYRSTPGLLVPVGSSWTPTYTDPPMTTAGMTRISLDDTGKLVELETVLPRGDDASAGAKPPPWPALFQAAGLDLTRFQPVAPVLLPQGFASDRAAWEGPLPGVDGGKVHVEAAAHRGAAVSFRATGPWEPIVPRTTPPTASTGFNWRVLANTLGTLVAIGTLLLARANLRAGRGDRRGAWRLFCFTFIALLASWIVGARHYNSLLIEDARFFEFVGYGLRRIGLIWLLYIALEPYVRRYAPGILMSWTRVLGGQFVDARVGRDVLVGVAFGVAVALLNVSYNLLLPLMIGGPPRQPRATNLRLLLDTSTAVSHILGMIPNNVSNGLLVATAFGVGRALTRRTWGGALLAAVMFGIFVLGEAGGDRFFLTVIFVAAFVIPLVAALIYFGILPVVIAFFVNQVLSNAPLTLQSSMPFAPIAFWVMALVLGLAMFGFYASRGGQPLFGRVLQPE